MRLTLRTLLAYMDGILEPEQAEVLRKKIEESDFAGKLMERIREVTRRLRLGAPHVEEKGALLDPNTVAEYLDNTLHGDRIPDFEKVCLESDIHLAEVASCHQILTMILGEAAEIDPATRQRMYRLVEQAAGTSKAGEAVGSSSSGAAGQTAGAGSEQARAVPSGPSASKPTVPEYLREPPKKGKFWVAALLLFLAGFATMILLGAFGLLEPGKPLARLLGISRPSEVAPSSPEAGASESSAQPTPQPTGQEKLAQPESVLPKSPQPSEKSPTEKAPLPEEVQKTPSLEPGKQKPTPPPEKPEEKPKLEVPPESPVAPEAKPPQEKPTPPEEAAKPTVQLLGRLVSDRELLLRLDAVQKDWWRIAPQGNLSSGERLLGWPTFRPVIGLSAGVTITLVGPAEVELLAGGDEGPPGMKILFGRTLLSTVGKENVPFRIQVEGLTGTLTLLDPDATAAIAVSRVHIPGNDPAAHPDPVRVEIYGTRGRAVWTPAAPVPVQPVQIVAPSLFLLEMMATEQKPTEGTFWKMTAAGVVPIEKIPEWITADTSNPLDRRAAPELEQKIQPDRLARIGLMELLEHRLAEVRALSTRCLGYLGEYHQIAALLNKSEERAAWFDSLELLSEAVVRSPESAAAVRAALEKQYGPQNAALLYRMLLGYSEPGLKSGEAAALVDLLEHNDLVFRVMSFWNLQKITGKGFYYQPEAPKTKRDPAVKRWRDWLAQLTAGKISLSKETPGSPGKEAPAAKETVSKPSEVPGSKLLEPQKESPKLAPEAPKEVKIPLPENPPAEKP